MLSLKRVVNCFQFVSLKYWAQPGRATFYLAVCCELLSVCIFEILSTTRQAVGYGAIELWIAFSLYLWNIEHNRNTRPHRSRWVVNCFQFVSLKYWAQPSATNYKDYYSCELLSVCIFEILSTTTAPDNVRYTLVVNCFQFVSLKYWAQHLLEFNPVFFSCELLSVCIFEILSTTRFPAWEKGWQLWIAFSLYLWNIEHNGSASIARTLPVVNCFQFVSLKYWAQRNNVPGNSDYCCELLSVCIFEILSTTSSGATYRSTALWIAFSLYLWNIEHNAGFRESRRYPVVNCFQFVSLKYWAQPGDTSGSRTICCELLSVCIFEILSTTKVLIFAFARSLWIAFSLYLWNIEHNTVLRGCPGCQVVNCFQFVSLKYWAQPRQIGRSWTISCELLSVCIFEILSTTSLMTASPRSLLWIAFSLYLWNIEHNIPEYNELYIRLLMLITEIRKCSKTAFLFIRKAVFFIPAHQNISSCCGVSGRSTGSWLRKNSIIPNCLSVSEKIIMSPFGARNDLTLLICTSAFSRLLQCRTYIEYCSIENPSFWSDFRNRAYCFLSFFVSVGRSKKTKTHIILYWFSRSVPIYFI